MARDREETDAAPAGREVGDRQAAVGSEGHVESNDHIFISIPAKPEYVALCRLAVTALAYRGGLSEEAVADLKVAVTEACTNSIAQLSSGLQQDGETGEAPAEIELEYELLGDRWIITVSDARDEPPEQEEIAAELPAERELGLVVMRALVDEAEMKGREGGGLSVRLIKYL